MKKNLFLSIIVITFVANITIMSNELTKGILLNVPANEYYEVKRLADEDTLKNGGEKVTIHDEMIELIKLGIELKKEEV